MILDGEYSIGPAAPGAGELCEQGDEECSLASIPSGWDETAPTCIVGESFDEGCASAPVLVGEGGAWSLVDLTGRSHVRVECLELTDASSCDSCASACTARARRA